MINLPTIRILSTNVSTSAARANAKQFCELQSPVLVKLVGPEQVIDELGSLENFGIVGGESPGEVECEAPDERGVVDLLGDRQPERAESIQNFVVDEVAARFAREINGIIGERNNHLDRHTLVQKPSDNDVTTATLDAGLMLVDGNC